MKLNKIILGAAALAASCAMASAQVAFKAGVDFTTYGLQQAFTNTNGTKAQTDPTAGYDPDGNVTIDVNVNAQSFAFELGLYFNADGGYDSYYDYSDNYYTHFYKGNMKVGFVNDQLNLYTGKFEDFNGGYIEDGAVLGAQYIANLADSTYGQYLTGLEFAPRAVNGLKVFAGFPILPIFGNGIQTNEFNQWKNLYKKAKIAASYTLPIDAVSVKLNAGYRYGTYYDGIDASTMQTFTETFTKSAFSEGYFQAVLPGLLDLVDLTVTYDIRYRPSSYTNALGETVEKTAMAHTAGVSAAMSLLDGALALGVEDRFFFAGDDYLHSDEKLIYDILAVNAEYALPGTKFSFGADIAGMFAADAMGTSFADGAINNDTYSSDEDIAMTLNSMATADLTGLSGAATTYVGCYACPYFKVNFSNGALKIGAEVAYTNFFNANAANSAVSYRVPVGLTFGF